MQSMQQKSEKHEVWYFQCMYKNGHERKDDKKLTDQILAFETLFSFLVGVVYAKVLFHI